VIQGEVAAGLGFEGVREAFARCFDELGETGAQYAAFVDGRQVADLRGGLERDSLVHVYSVTKPMAAFCVLVLADRGVLWRRRSAAGPAVVRSDWSTSSGEQ